MLDQADQPIIIAGILIPTSDPKFLAVLAVHVPAGIVAVFSAATAALSRKERGRHLRAGLVYFRALTVVTGTMAALAVMRWSHAYHLFVLGALSFASAYTGRRFVTQRSRWRYRGHLIGMGASFVLLLIAFYVDNGRNLPVWKDLPPTAYWALPLAVGVPLIARALARHPLAVAERRRAHAPPNEDA